MQETLASNRSLDIFRAIRFINDELRINFLGICSVSIIRVDGVHDIGPHSGETLDFSPLLTQPLLPQNNTLRTVCSVPWSSSWLVFKKAFRPRSNLRSVELYGIPRLDVSSSFQSTVRNGRFREATARTEIIEKYCWMSKVWIKQVKLSGTKVSYLDFVISSAGQQKKKNLRLFSFGDCTLRANSCANT
jgi:hypothetical protein